MCSKVEIVIKAIQSGRFGDPNIFDPLIATLRNDFYLINQDFESCKFINSEKKDLQTMDKVYQTFQNKDAWAKKSVLAALSMGRFSSDRSIQDYAKHIWNIFPSRVPNDCCM